jgi:hypothetical protein
MQKNQLSNEKYKGLCKISPPPLQVLSPSIIHVTGIVYFCAFVCLFVGTGVSVCQVLQAFEVFSHQGKMGIVSTLLGVSELIWIVLLIL